jgi:plasmid maintenance system antidote protein VapI
MVYKTGMRPIDPRAVLRKDFLKPLGLTASALAKAPRVCASHQSRYDLRTAEKANSMKFNHEIKPFTGNPAAATLLEQSPPAERSDSDAAQD